MNWKTGFWITAAVLFSAAHLAVAAEATITSDELDLQDNGARTIFIGHVILKQAPYEIRSDRMVRTKLSGHVDAHGHVIGTWVSPKKEKIRVESESALYEPETNTVEVWGKTQVAVQLDGEKGKATFHGNRGWVYTETPGRAKLSGQVRGHIIPAGSS